MDKAKAINLLKMAVPIKALTQQEYAEFIEAVNTAIKALEAKPCEDTISRQAAIDALDCLNGVEEVLRSLPSVQSELAKDINVPRNDTISRQAAIRWVKTECNPYGKPTLDFESGIKVIDHLKQMPSAQPQPQWIPVSERMPEDYVDVLAWFEYFKYGNYNRMYATHGIGNYSKEYNSWTINHETGWKDLHVFAWMPLPESYGKEDVQDE